MLTARILVGELCGRDKLFTILVNFVQLYNHKKSSFYYIAMEFTRIRVVLSIKNGAALTNMRHELSKKLAKYHVINLRCTIYIAELKRPLEVQSKSIA